MLTNRNQTVNANHNARYTVIVFNMEGSVISATDVNQKQRVCRSDICLQLNTALESLDKTLDLLR